MVVGGKNLEAITLEENAPEEFENVVEVCEVTFLNASGIKDANGPRICVNNVLFSQKLLGR